MGRSNLEMGGIVAVAETPVLAEAPRVEFAAGGEGGGVGGPAGHVANPLRLERLDQTRLVAC